MSGKSKIMSTCKKLSLEVVNLEFDKAASPTPSGYVMGGTWILELTCEGEEACFIGSAKEIVDKLNDSFYEI